MPFNEHTEALVLNECFYLLPLNLIFQILRENNYILLLGGLFQILARAPLWPVLTFFKIDFRQYK